MVHEVCVRGGGGGDIHHLHRTHNGLFTRNVYV